MKQHNNIELNGSMLLTKTKIMTIETINQGQLDRLLEIQKNHPLLTFQNDGYTYPKKSEWSDEDNVAFKEAQDLASDHIKGFSELNHFRMSRKGELQIRFQYNYGYDGGHSFTGVGYIPKKI
jgi:hypothetical protein